MQHFDLYQFFVADFNKTMIPLVLVGYEMIIANSALCALLAIYHLISNECSWNKVLITPGSQRVKGSSRCGM